MEEEDQEERDRREDNVEEDEAEVEKEQNGTERTTTQAYCKVWRTVAPILEGTVRAVAHGMANQSHFQLQRGRRSEAVRRADGCHDSLLPPRTSLPTACSAHTISIGRVNLCFSFTNYAFDVL